MEEFTLVGLSILCLLIGPMLFLYQKKKKLSYVNLLITLSSLAIWFSLIAGWVSEQFWIIMWNATLLGSVLFLVIGFSSMFIKIKQINRYLLPFFVLAISVSSLLIGNHIGSDTQLNVFVLYSFAYFTPLFVGLIAVISATQYFKNTNSVS
ncbi:hypothetical protein LGQ02_11320 [Bacillus shivajii]|uniref:hypothetical protein n=1 Tax=Bacillus shivajii TaxID=1983719 RepID=UPI001CFA6A4B|nr:hypothetical protein [Bacillus shivajii]UCZ51467.1 hypothetical protein LGQ02_11320 [Bacillus shivajii]